METKAADRGARLEALIDARGLRKGWVAAQMGVSPSLLSRWMSGERTIGPERAARLAELLGVSPEVFA